MRPRVLIAGGGHAGVAAARAIGEDAEVTILDRRRHFELSERVHEVVAGRRAARTLRVPLAALAADLGHRFAHDELRALELDRRRAIGAREVYEYDALILALGLERAPPSPHALAIDDLDAAKRARDRVEVLARRGEPAWITVVGGGAAGVELAGALACAHRRRGHLELRLVERRSRLLHGWPKRLARRVEALCRDEGVQLRLDAKVRAVGPDHVVVDGDPLRSELTLWAGPRTPHAALRAAGLGGEVEDTLLAAGHEHVFVAGDLAGFDAPRSAAEAFAMGERAGANALRVLEGRRPRRHRAVSEGRALGFGDRASFWVDEDGEPMEGELLELARELQLHATLAAIDETLAGGADRAAERLAGAKGPTLELLARYLGG